jgi:hypothetical protein
LFLVCLVILAICGYYIYENVPGKPISLTALDEEKTEEIVDYGNTPMFMEKLRFGKNVISYYIEDTCSKTRKERMVEAFDIFSNEMRIISFYEENYQNADILVGCSNDYIQIDENLFAAGEGGPSQIINTTNYKVIKNGKISLYKKSECKLPVVELHELSHVFGFDHSLDKKSIMYNISNCDQRITPDMVRALNYLYSIPSKPELEITELSATRKGRYLNFNITVTNTGLADTNQSSLTLFADGKEFQTIDLKEIGIGFGRILSAENIKMPSRDPERVKFYVDFNKVVDELDETNNFLILT